MPKWLIVLCGIAAGFIVLRALANIALAIKGD
jgi:hypothetical protein